MQVLVIGDKRFSNTGATRPIILSTKKLEPEPGDMLRDRNIVFKRAVEQAEARIRKRVLVK